MIGSLLIMAAITLSNMKKRILLHKLIFAEVSTYHSYPGILSRSKLDTQASRSLSPIVPAYGWNMLCDATRTNPKLVPHS